MVSSGPADPMRASRFRHRIFAFVRFWPLLAIAGTLSIAISAASCIYALAMIALGSSSDSWLALGATFGIVGLLSWVAALSSVESPGRRELPASRAAWHGRRVLWGGVAVGLLVSASSLPLALIPAAILLGLIIALLSSAVRPGPNEGDLISMRAGRGYQVAKVLCRDAQSVHLRVIADYTTRPRGIPLSTIDGIVDTTRLEALSHNELKARGTRFIWRMALTEGERQI